ncbi:GspE/PulE family protein [Sulfuriroseicoccus oceanibius]|uniref:Flp pilus assembly complex ATPase component TadA n=1 Tax=Sulfuriroseicoccus oceanibius TaxID=2707525 RepID=A0A6B3LBD3_9BACT|nr:ATPase, T2SS/T4P/T4SS family [Sulfuriroseicoccus oceanibius]QQL44486.1 Flp pilus assembly complex ATPase component TadA [Sulfuriroseicoccus oceanibius]
MISIDSITFNEGISDRIMARLEAHDPAIANINHDQIESKTTRSTLMAAIASLRDLPFIPKVAALTDMELVRVCDPKVLNRGMFAPIAREGKFLIVAVCDPWNDLPLDYLGLIFPELEITMVVTLPSEITKIVEVLSSTAGPGKSELEAIEVEDTDDEIQDFDVLKKYDEPIAQLIATMMATAVQLGVSDIHIKVEKDTFYYSYRLDGDLGEKYQLPMKLRDRVDAFLMNLMKLATEKRSTSPGISGRFSLSYLHRSIDVRYERHRTYRGYHVTMRLLDKGNLSVALGKGNMAFDPETLFELRRVMRIPAGIIVMSGPTGSGKSTTLNAMLRELNEPEVNILTLENPVEDEIPGVTHCDLKGPAEFKPMISSFMRSDPDIILMGEVRDTESAELAIEAAITGHKVLTTVHTPRASQIIERFEQLGMERWKIAQTLKAACAQRLCKELCTSCKIRLDGVSEEDRRVFNLEEEWAHKEVYKAAPEGCSECGGSGYKGRTAILEIIPISPSVSDELSKGTLSPYELEIRIQEEGRLPSLRKSGLRLLEAGKTDLKALAKVIDMTYTD